MIETLVGLLILALAGAAGVFLLLLPAGILGVLTERWSRPARILFGLALAAVLWLGCDVLKISTAWAGFIFGLAVIGLSESLAWQVSLSMLSWSWAIMHALMSGIDKYGSGAVLIFWGFWAFIFIPQTLKTAYCGSNADFFQRLWAEGGFDAEPAKPGERRRP